VTALAGQKERVWRKADRDIPVGRQDGIFVTIFVRDHAAAGRPGGACGQACLQHVPLAPRGGADLNPPFHAFEIPAQDEVDNPSDGIGAVDRRGAVREDFHPLDRAERDQ